MQNPEFFSNHASYFLLRLLYFAADKYITEQLH